MWYHTGLVELQSDYLVIDVDKELAADAERKQSASAHVRSLLRSLVRREAKGGILIFDSGSGPGLARGPQPQYSPGVQAPGGWPSEARSLDGTWQGQQALLDALAEGASIAFPRSAVSPAALFHQALAGPLEAALLGSRPPWDRGFEAVAVSRAAAEAAIAEEWPRTLSGGAFATFLAAWLASAEPVRLAGEARAEAVALEDFERRFPDWLSGLFQALCGREKKWVEETSVALGEAADAQPVALGSRQIFLARAFERFEQTRRSFGAVLQDHTAHALEIAFGCSIPDLSAPLWADVVFDALLTSRRDEAAGEIASVLLAALYLRAGSGLAETLSELTFFESIQAFSQRRGTFLRRWNAGRRAPADESPAETASL